ncbi:MULTISPECIES: riboflavin kinase [unclassified Arthrobacter]|uniref:riboflavin kinase n=1 Tax=unclassified Arthrobacter TaxID=235627 RepID=UPI002882EFB7|nr:MULTISPECIES: riboflavin kinase [unclassified Arthrobacter]
MAHIISGTVEHGDARGRLLGFPTANVAGDFSPDVEGIWTAYAVVHGIGSFRATVSIGRRPTYYADSAEMLVEAHLLDFDGDIYGCRLNIELVSFLRPQMRCQTETELVQLIAGDVRSTQAMAAPGCSQGAHGATRRSHMSIVAQP